MYIAGLSLVTLLMAGMFASPLAAVELDKESGAEDLALWRGEAAAGTRATASPPAIGDLQ